MADKSSLILLTTVAEVVKAFDGTKAMAAWAGLSMSSISKWLSQGWIPPNWYVAISDELCRKGFAAPPEIFRQSLPRTESHRTADA